MKTSISIIPENKLKQKKKKTNPHKLKQNQESKLRLSTPATQLFDTLIKNNIRRKWSKTILTVILKMFRKKKNSCDLSALIFHNCKLKLRRERHLQRCSTPDHIQEESQNQCLKCAKNKVLREQVYHLYLCMRGLYIVNSYQTHHKVNNLSNTNTVSV